MTDKTNPPVFLKLLRDHGEKGQTWDLTKKESYRIGRSPNNDICLPYSWVSRKHALLQLESDGRFHIIDLGSSNGTKLNSQRVQGISALRSGDQIVIGNSCLNFFQENDYLQPNESHDTEYFDDEETVIPIEKETITVLVCDIHDFTKLSEIFGDKKITKILRYWVKQVNIIIANHHGQVDKYIGDAVLAVWFGKNNIENKIIHALKSAMEISIMTKKLGSNIKDMPWPLQIGGAINTGEAITGNIGSDGGNRDFTVIGDTVNVVFRLEGKTSQNELDLLVGENSGCHLKNIKKYFTKKKYFLKGKEAQLTAYGTSFKKLESFLKKEY
jgi:adenylate cyclase